MKTTKLAQGVNWKKKRNLIIVGSVLVLVFILMGVPTIVRAYDVAVVNQTLREVESLAKAGKTEEALEKLKTTEKRYMTDEQHRQVEKQTVALTPLNYTPAPKGMSIEAFDQMLRDRGVQGILFPASPAPTASPSVRKLISPSPIPPASPTNLKVLCHYDERCGGTKTTTQTECMSTTCCFNGNTYEVKSKMDCQKQADEIAKKQADAWNAEYEQIRADIEAMQKATESPNQQNEQYQAALLEDCREKARRTYSQPFMGGQSGNGYIVGESAEIRQKLNQALAQCLELYGGQ